MGDLGEDFCAMLVDGGGRVDEVGDYLVVVELDTTPVEGGGGRVDSGRAVADDQASSASGLLGLVGVELGTGHTVFSEDRRVARADNAVSYDYVTHGQWAEQVGEWGCCHCQSSSDRGVDSISTVCRVSRLHQRYGVPGGARCLGERERRADEHELVDLVSGQFFQVHVFQQVDA